MGCALSGKGCQCHRGQRGIHIDFEKSAIDGEDHNEGQHRNKQAPQQRHQPEGDTCQKAHISDGVRDLLRQRHGCAGQAADAARRRCHNAAAHIKYIYQQIHAVGDTQLCQHKVDKVPQQVLRPLKVPKAGCAAKDTDGKEQHQQPVTNGLHPAVDGHNRLPDRAAFESLRRFCQQRPHLRHFAVPSCKCVGQVFYDPVIIQMKITSHKGAGRSAARQYLPALFIRSRRWRSEFPLQRRSLSHQRGKESPAFSGWHRGTGSTYPPARCPSRE